MGDSSRAIGAAFGLRHDAVHRHMRGHLGRSLSVAIASQDMPLQPVAPIAAEPDAPASSHVPRAWQLDEASAGDAEPQSAPPVSTGASPAPFMPITVPAAPSATPAGPFDPLAAIYALHARILALVTRAETSGDDRLAVSAIREARGVVDTLARIAPAFGTATATGSAVPLANSPEWHAVRGVLVAALAPHPDAALAVADALEEAGLLS